MACLVQFAFVNVNANTVSHDVPCTDTVTRVIIKAKLAAHLTGGAWIRCARLSLQLTPITCVARHTAAYKMANLVDALSVYAHCVIFAVVDVGLTPVSSDARYTGARSHSLRARAGSTR